MIWGLLHGVALIAVQEARRRSPRGARLPVWLGASLTLYWVGLTWIFFRDGLDFSALMSEEMTFGGIVIDPVIVPDFRLVQALQSFFSIAVVGITASIYPAYHATKIDVGEALKFE